MTRRLPRDEAGASSVEYGLLVVLIAGAIILVTVALGSVVRGTYSTTCDELSGGLTATGGAATSC